MRIIIAGMGDVGYQLAKQLSNESHDIIAIDQNSDRLSYSDQMADILTINCLLYTSPSPRDLTRSRMPSSA